MVIEFSVGGQKYNVGKMAKEIKLNDVLNALPEKDRKLYSSHITTIFNKIAGEDKKLTGDELGAFFLNLAEAAGDDKILSDKELDNFASSRASNIAGIYYGSIYKTFINVIFKQNQKQVEAEEAYAKKHADRVKEKTVERVISGNKTVETTKYPDGKEIIDTYLGGKLAQRVYKQDGQLLKTIDFNKDGTQTIRKPVEKEVNRNTGKKSNDKVDSVKIKEEFTTYDKDNKVVAKGFVQEDGTKVEMKLDKDGKTTERITTYPKGDDVYKNGAVRSEKYNDKGQVTDETFKENGNVTTRHYDYDENGDRTKETYTDAKNHYKSTTYLKNGYPTKEVSNENGRIREQYYEKDSFNVKKEVVKEGENTWVTEYTRDKEGRVLKEVHTTNGKVDDTVTYKYNKDGTITETHNNNDYASTITKNAKTGYPISDVTRYKNGDTTTRKYDKSGHETESVTVDKNNVRKSKSQNVYDKKENLAKTIYYDEKDNISISIEYQHDAQGNTISEITKDANGIPQESWEYGKKSTTLTNYDGNGRPVCSWEETKTNPPVRIYKNGRGEEITEQEYEKLSSIARSEHKPQKPEAER